MYNPIRPGVRGGRDQFKWQQVKEDKYRENYLGNSLMAPVGRWQTGKDLIWYAKDKVIDSNSKIDDLKKADKAQLVSELEMIKLKEQALLKTALLHGFGHVSSSSEVSGLELRQVIGDSVSSNDQYGSLEKDNGIPEFTGIGFKGSYIIPSMKKDTPSASEIGNLSICRSHKSLSPKIKSINVNASNEKKTDLPNSLFRKHKDEHHGKEMRRRHDNSKSNLRHDKTGTQYIESFHNQKSKF